MLALLYIRNPGPPLPKPAHDTCCAPATPPAPSALDSAGHGLQQFLFADELTSASAPCTHSTKPKLKPKPMPMPPSQQQPQLQQQQRPALGSLQCGWDVIARPILPVPSGWPAAPWHWRPYSHMVVVRSQFRIDRPPSRPASSIYRFHLRHSMPVNHSFHCPPSGTPSLA